MNNNNQPTGAFDQNKFDSILKQYNYTPPAQPGQPQDWYTQVKQKLNPTPVASPTSVGDELKSGYDKYASGVNKVAGDTFASIQNAGQEISKTTSDFANGTQNLKTAAQAVLDTAGEFSKGAVGAISAPVSDAIHATGEFLGNAGETPSGEKLDEMNAQADAFKGVSDKVKADYASFKESHPTLAKNIENGGNIAQLLALFAGEKPATDIVSKAGDIATTGADSLKAGVENTKELLNTPPVGPEIPPTPEATPAKPNLQVIADKISPKPTLKEARLATEQGRLYKGKDAGLFGSKTADQVAATTQQANSARTIAKLIPDAETLDEPTLYTEMKSKIGELANNLKPEMEKVPINEATVEKITNDWEKVKDEQKSNAYTPSDVNVKALQADFEKRLQASRNGNMNDLWETRQAYDDSVPDSVKQAGQNSSESLQVKREMWQQNRQILSDAINDSENGLGDTSKQAFSDMRDLYEGKTGILSKAKIDTTTEPGSIIKAGKDILKKAVPFGIGAHL